MVEQRVKTVSQWFDSTPNHEIFRFLSEFSSKDLEGIKIFLIFVKQMDSGMVFYVVVPHTHPT
jgi:hypothetical protein